MSRKRKTDVVRLKQHRWCSGVSILFRKKTQGIDSCFALVSPTRKHQVKMALVSTLPILALFSHPFAHIFSFFLFLSPSLSTESIDHIPCIHFFSEEIGEAEEKERVATRVFNIVLIFLFKHCPYFSLSQGETPTPHG